MNIRRDLEILNDDYVNTIGAQINPNDACSDPIDARESSNGTPDSSNDALNSLINDFDISNDAHGNSNGAPGNLMNDFDNSKDAPDSLIDDLGNPGDGFTI